MAFLEIRERQLRATGTADVTLAVVPAGTLVFLYGAQVTTAAGAGTCIVTADGATLMASADLAPTATGLKRNTTPGPYLMKAEATILCDNTGFTGSPDITFFFGMAKVAPGA